VVIGTDCKKVIPGEPLFQQLKHFFKIHYDFTKQSTFLYWGRRGRGRMVVAFTTTCAISPVFSNNWQFLSMKKFVSWFCFMVFNATFNNISVISWWSVLLIEETRENH
jgi:hypothetical protein